MKVLICCFDIGIFFCRWTLAKFATLNLQLVEMLLLMLLLLLLFLLLLLMEESLLMDTYKFFQVGQNSRFGFDSIENFLCSENSRFIFIFLRMWKNRYLTFEGKSLIIVYSLKGSLIFPWIRQLTPPTIKNRTTIHTQ